MLKKIETVLKDLDAKINDADDAVKEEKERIESELKNFDDWSATSIEYYARKMKEASDRKKHLIEQKRAIVWLTKED